MNLGHGCKLNQPPLPNQPFAGKGCKMGQASIRSHGVTLWGLAISTLKSILKQKKNYGNSNISPCKNIIFKQIPLKRNQNPSRYYNSITNLKFQHKPKYHLSKILISKWTYYLGAKIP
jgi:hypothetical protein